MTAVLWSCRLSCLSDFERRLLGCRLKAERKNQAASADVVNGFAETGDCCRASQIFGDKQVNREEKAELLSEMNELISGSEAVVIAHYRGLTVAEMEALRKKARELGAGLRVTKNRITKLALKGTNFEALNDLFTGPAIMAYSSDPIAACKLCIQFAKENEKFLVVGGALSSGVLSMAEIERLATIPSMDELRAKIIGLLQAPGAALARVTKAYSEKEAA